LRSGLEEFTRVIQQHKEVVARRQGLQAHGEHHPSDTLFQEISGLQHDESTFETWRTANAPRAKILALRIEELKNENVHI
jgi:hypothetical protein